jgi:hypothetical protein
MLTFIFNIIGSIVANRTEVKEWEVWTVEPYDDGFALRSWNGRYLTILRSKYNRHHIYYAHITH